MKQETVLSEKFAVLSDEELLEISGEGKHALALFHGALAGASVGAFFGPWGFAGGAVVGGAAGVIESYL